MSGGHFDYDQFKIQDIADEIERICDENEYEFSDKTIAKFRNAIPILREAFIYCHRIDWLLSGDDGEESFEERLKSELSKGGLDE